MAFARHSGASVASRQRCNSNVPEKEAPGEKGAKQILAAEQFAEKSEKQIPRGAKALLVMTRILRDFYGVVKATAPSKSPQAKFFGNLQRVGFIRV
jgi:hypothetical protein